MRLGSHNKRFLALLINQYSALVGDGLTIVWDTMSVQMAYLIMAHQNHLQLARLFEAIYSEQDCYVLHIDRSAPEDCHLFASRKAGELANVHSLRSRRVHWPGYSLVEITLEAIRHLLSTNAEWTYFVNLTGQDFPIKPQTMIREGLSAFPGRNYIDWNDPLIIWDKPQDRWRGVFLELPFCRDVVRVPKLRINRDYLLEGQKIYGGSAWVILSREFCSYIADGRNIRKYEKFFRHTAFPDEMFLQTIALNSVFRDSVVNDNKRFIVFKEGRARPKVIRVEHLDSLLKSGAYFARKFDPMVDAEVIRLLEKRIAGS